MAGFAALAARFARLLGGELVCGALLMSGLPTLAARLARLLGGELVSSAFLMAVAVLLSIELYRKGTRLDSKK